MNERDLLAERFEEERARLRSVAYRVLGSLSEADDAVQEAWLRVSRADTSEVEKLDAWLTTVVARVSLNMLRSRTVRHEEPLDVRVPDPIVDRADGTQPEHEALLADSVGLALLVVLETLSPAERLAPTAAREVRGAEAVAGQARFYSRLGLEQHLVLVNGAPGMVTLRDGKLFSVGGFTVRGGRIVAMDILADPARLADLDLSAVGLSGAG